MTSITKPEPLVPPERIRGVAERIDAEGKVVIPLDRDGVATAVRELVDERRRRRAWPSASCNAWRNPVHEAGVAATSSGASTRRPRSSSASAAGLSPGRRRVRPDEHRHRGRLRRARPCGGTSPASRRQLRADGFAGRILVMQGNGGLTSHDGGDADLDAPVRARPAGCSPRPRWRRRSATRGRSPPTWAARASTSESSTAATGATPTSRSSSASGSSSRSPTSPRSVPAAGRWPGSTRRRGGCSSARERRAPGPGPVCYGLGGTVPTVTDADLVLGYLDPDYFLGGRRRLDRAAARGGHRASRSARPLGLDAVEAAAGIVRIIDSKMSDLIRREVIRSGRLPEDVRPLRVRRRQPGPRRRLRPRPRRARDRRLPDLAGLLAPSGSPAPTSSTPASRPGPTRCRCPAAELNADLDALEASLAAELGPGRPGRGARVPPLRDAPVPSPEHRRGDRPAVGPLHRRAGRRPCRGSSSSTTSGSTAEGVAYAEAGLDIAGLRVDAVGPRRQAGAPPVARPAAAVPGDAPKGERRAWFDGALRRDARLRRGPPRDRRPPRRARRSSSRRSPPSSCRPGPRLTVDPYPQPGHPAMTTRPSERPRIDPVDFEIFAHRLWAIGEEGRIALQRVTASPIVAQGGECMCSFYDADGTMILACSGHLRFAAATSDAIRRMIDWFDERPGHPRRRRVHHQRPLRRGLAHLRHHADRPDLPRRPAGRLGRLELATPPTPAGSSAAPRRRSSTRASGSWA